MIDLSNKKNVQQHHDSFMKTSNDLIDYIKKLQEKYESIYGPHLEVVKDRDAIRDDTQSRISGSNIKLDKQLKNCTNDEINREVLNAMDSIPEDKREPIQINLLKINNRYLQLNKSAKELIALMEELGIYRVPEKDEKEEVVLDFSKLKKKKTSQAKKNSVEKKDIQEQKEVVKQNEQTEIQDKYKGMETVVSRHPASKELIDSLNANLSSKRQTTDENLETIFATDEEIIDEESLLDTSELESIQEEIKTVSDQIDQQNEKEELPIEDNNQEYILFTIDDKVTLKEIAKNVYKDENCWINLYKYGQNYFKIMRISKEFDIDVEFIASTPGYLENVTLQFPTIIPTEEETIDEQIEEYSSYRRAA